MAFVGLSGLPGFPGQVVSLEQLRASFNPSSTSTSTSTPKKFTAGEIKSIEELSKNLHAHVEESFGNLLGQIKELEKRPQSPPINIDEIINQVKQSIKKDIETILKDPKTIESLKDRIIDKQFKKDLDSSIQAQFRTLSESLRKELATLQAAQGALSKEQGALKAAQDTINAEHTALQAAQGAINAEHARLKEAHTTLQAAHEEIKARLSPLEAYLNDELKKNISKLIKAFPNMTEAQIKGALDGINQVLDGVTKDDIQLLHGFDKRITELTAQLKTKLTDDSLTGLRTSVTILRRDLDKAESSIPDITKDSFDRLSTTVNDLINIEIPRVDALITKRVTPEELETELENYERKKTKPKESGYIQNQNQNLFKPSPYLQIYPAKGARSTSIPPKLVTAADNKYLIGGSKYSYNKYSRKNLSESSDELELNNTLSDTSVN